MHDDKNEIAPTMWRRSVSRRRRATTTLILAALLLAPACRPPEDDGHADDHADAADADHGHSHGDEDDGWAVTAWGDRFEIFAEAGPLAVGQISRSHTHVTDLADFSAVQTGRVAAVLKAPDGRESIFEQTEALRDGIFDVEIAPAEAGEYDLAFRVDTAAGSEEIPAGRLRVAPAGDGSEAEPGGLLDAPAPPSAGDEIVPFLKEQQWRIAFATEWVRSGELADSVRGFGEVRPVAGGEIVLTAPVDAVVMPPGAGTPPWPYPGLAVARGAGVFRLASQIHDDHSLSELEADVRVRASELALVEANRERFQQLFEAGVTSSQQTEEAAAEVTEHQALLEAARDDLASARAARGGDGIAEAVMLGAPWSGRVAAVEITPGQAVEAGAPLARLVKTDPLWVEVALRPADAARFSSDPAGLNLSLAGLDRPLAFDAGDVRLVSRFPEIDPHTGTVKVLLEVPGERDELRLGSAVEAEILLPATRAGIVVPSSGLVDDGGVSVVYVQADGESFARLEVRVVVQQGDRMLVTGLMAGQRLVTRGGAAIRRSVLMAGGEAHGHQH